jgi:L-ribulose-5-phosphate 4-epimerase
MKKNLSQLGKTVITACRILSQRRLVYGFGHVSARIPGTDRFLMTPRISLELVRERDLLVIDLAGETVQGKSRPPFETALHTAIYRKRDDVNAVARFHARTANIFSVTERTLEPVHNHGSFFSGGVPVFAKTDLISTIQLGEEVAATMGARLAVLLRGNGQVTVGRSVPEAVILAIYLEEAADILHGALQIGTPRALTVEESVSRQAETLPPVDLERAWNFFKTNVRRR